MDTKQQNTAIKKLASRVKKMEELTGNAYYKELEEVKNEFLRLYGADREMKYCNAYSVKVLFVLNRRFRFEPFHLFGYKVDI